MEKEALEKILDNNKQISKLLKENEELLRKEGYDPPANNFVLSPHERIVFPTGYIRTVPRFIEKYHLREIFPKRYSRHNVTYALEVSDLINYVFNRIHIYGAVETVFYKLAIVNLVSIMEAIILEAANNICPNAKVCKNTKLCYKHFSRNERNNVRLALNKLVLIEILDFDEEKLERIQYIVELRNRIHIRLSLDGEVQSDNYNLQLYNETISFLQEIDQQIYEKGVPLYGCN